MANNVASERLWILDSAAVIKAVGVPVKVRKLVLFPSAVDDDAIIEEYGADAVLRTALHIKARKLTGDTSPVDMDFGPDCRELNGFNLATIDGTAILHVYIGKG